MCLVRVLRKLYWKKSFLSEKLKLNRTKTWRSLKRIAKITEKGYGYPLVTFEPTFKKWSLNRTDYEIMED
jgi:hypothetical protein